MGPQFLRRLSDAGHLGGVDGRVARSLLSWSAGNVGAGAEEVLSENAVARRGSLRGDSVSGR